MTLDENTIISLVPVMPSLFTGTNAETVTIQVFSGSEVLTDTFEIKMRTLILDILPFFRE